MSAKVYKQVRVECDGCGEWATDTSTIYELRRQLRKVSGWMVARGGKDYCRDCADRLRLLAKVGRKRK